MLTFEDFFNKFCSPPTILGTCGIQDLKANHVSYCRDKKYIKFIEPNKQVYIMIPENPRQFTQKIPGNYYIVTNDPVRDFLAIHNYFHSTFRALNSNWKDRKDSSSKIDNSSIIHESVIMGSNVSIESGVIIHPHVVIGNNVFIGQETEILPSATIYDNSSIGEHCVIESGSRIGGEGFRIIRNSEKIPIRLKHIGGVKIGNNVEIGNNCTIDRCTFQDTIIGDNVKIDNLTHIGHNVHIAENTIIAACVCVAGSVEIGKNVWIGIGASISNGIKIPDDTEILMNAVVASTITKPGSYAGFYAIPNDSWLLEMKDKYKNYVHKKNLEK